MTVLPVRRDGLTWALFALIATLAVLQAGVGGLLPFLQAEFDMSHTVESLHITALGVGGLTAGLVAERVRRRVGREAMLLGIAVLAVVAAGLLAAARGPVWSIVALVLVGFTVGGALIVGQSLLVARSGSAAPRMIGEYNLAYSVGAVAALFGLPVLTAAVTGWRTLPLAQGLVLAALVVPWLVKVRRDAVVDPVVSEGGRTGGWTLDRPGVSLVAMCLCVAVEWSFLFWLATHLVAVGGHTPQTAALVTAVMWGVILAARVLGTRLLPRRGGAGVLTGSLLLALLAAVVLSQAQTVWLAVVAAVLAGAAAANLYPASVAFVVSGAPPGRADAVVARATLLSSGTSIVFPLLLGRLADAVGLSMAFWAVPVTALCALAAVRLAGPRSTVNSHVAALTDTERVLEGDPS